MATSYAAGCPEERALRVMFQPTPHVMKMGVATNCAPDRLAPNVAIMRQMSAIMCAKCRKCAPNVGKYTRGVRSKQQITTATAGGEKDEKHMRG